MKDDDALEALFRAEQLEAPPPLVARHGLVRLDAALKAGVASMPVPSGPLKLGTFAAAPWLAVGALTALLGGASWMLVPSSPAPAPSSSPALAPSSRARAAVADPIVAPSSAPVQQPSEHEEVAKEREHELQREPPVRLEPRETKLEEPARASTFPEELRLIHFAKQALDRGNAPLAERWLSLHRERFPGGVFSGEREALGVLLACGRSADAGRERARRFVASHPASPLVDRIERTCGLDPATHRKSAPALEGK